MVLFWVCSKHTATRKITTCFHKLTQRQGCRRCDDAKSKLTKQRIAKCKDFLCALTPTFSQPPCSPLQGPQPLPFTPLQSHYKALSSMCIYVFVCACMYVFMFKRQRPYVAFWVSKHETYLATYKYLFWLFFLSCVCFCVCTCMSFPYHTPALTNSFKDMFSGHFDLSY